MGYHPPPRCIRHLAMWFLLEQCNVMLRLLQPAQELSEEIDYLLVIKMLKCVALAAKMASQGGNLHYGTSLADNILLQADLLHTLVERGCLNLLPVHSNYPQNPYIDASVMRKLRDRLLEEEQWKVALEVPLHQKVFFLGGFLQ